MDVGNWERDCLIRSAQELQALVQRVDSECPKCHSIRINSLSQFYVSATVSGLMSPTESGSELIDEKMKLCMASE